MQWLWCWRCKCEMPMMDEQEYAEAARLHHAAILSVKQFRETMRASIDHPSIHDLYLPVRVYYEELTGVKDCHQNAIMHHRISLYGPPCKQCGRPLRTPKAKLCGSCMFPVGPARG